MRQLNNVLVALVKCAGFWEGHSSVLSWRKPGQYQNRTICIRACTYEILTKSKRFDTRRYKRIRSSDNQVRDLIQFNRIVCLPSIGCLCHLL